MNNSTAAANSPPVLSPAAALLPRAEGIAFAALFVAEFLTIIAGNSAVVVVFARTRTLRRRKPHWLLINLAVADLLVGSVAGPCWLYFLGAKSELWDYEHRNDQTVALETLILFAPCASLLGLAVISLERMYATLWPWRHHALSARHYHVAIALSWCFPGLLPGVSAAERHGQISFDAFNFIWLAQSCFLFLVIVFSYVSIWIKFRFYRHTDSASRSRPKQEEKLTVSSFFVTVASVLTALPGIALSVAVHYSPLRQVLSGLGLQRALLFGAMLIFASSFVNPVIYSFRMPSFRRAAAKVLFRRPHKHTHASRRRKRLRKERK